MLARPGLPYGPRRGLYPGAPGRAPPCAGEASPRARPSVRAWAGAAPRRQHLGASPGPPMRSRAALAPSQRGEPRQGNVRTHALQAPRPPDSEGCWSTCEPTAPGGRDFYRPAGVGIRAAPHLQNTPPRASHLSAHRSRCCTSPNISTIHPIGPPTFSHLPSPPGGTFLHRTRSTPPPRIFPPCTL
jgi:hypothetical protein